MNPEASAPAARTDAGPAASGRLVAAGKWFQRGGRPFVIHGVTYGPFGPESVRAGLPEPERVASDLDALTAWGANAVRLYHVPPPWFLDACAARDLVVLAGIPWTDHVDFLANRRDRRAARTAVAQAASAMAARPEVGLLLVGNELHAPLVRWLGARRVEAFLEELLAVARDHAPETLAAYANYPSTEYLQPGNADCCAFNVYLEEPDAFRRYLARLHSIAGDKPLILTELGADARRLGPDRQASLLAETVRACREGGAAGQVIFSFTDEWHRGGEQVTGWDFGLTDAARRPRPSWHALAGGWPAATLPPPPPHGWPRISVIICTRNGGRTLPDALAALDRLTYPDFETIVVDDGSSEDIRALCAPWPDVRCLRQEALGLGVARNAGAAAATGDLLVYTDDDCLPESSWLHHLARAFIDPEAAAAGGPNIPPPPRSRAEACVAAAPGGPAHVLLTDSWAEHVPGCNMAVRRSVFTEIGGFRPRYHAAGDDVDFCWRLLERGHRIAFAPAAMVWHRRRFTARAYLNQQAGYGKAEALLMARHSARFGQLGGARWHGAVYQPAIRRLAHLGSRIYSGVFGSAGYQAVYRGPESELGWLVTGFPWWTLTIAMALQHWWWPAAPWVAVAMTVIPLVHTFRQARRLVIDPAWDGPRARLLLWWLLLAQPVVRSWARFAWNLRLSSAPGGTWLARSDDPRPRVWLYKRVADLAFWSDTGLDRDHLLSALQQQLPAEGFTPEPDDGWRDWDLELPVGRWWRLRLATVTEFHNAGGRLTRVRLASRSTPLTLVCWALALIAVALACALTPLKFIWAFGLLFALSVLVESRHQAAVSRASTLVSRTAAAAGFLSSSPDGRQDGDGPANA